MDLRDALSIPAVHPAFVGIIVGSRSYVVELANIRAGERVLDLGCGPADVVACLPEGVDYVGIDVSGEYIAAARKRFGGARARFVRAALRDFVADEPAAFDLVLGYGVLHHVDDVEAAGAFDVARQALRPDGRMVTIDPCLIDGQPPLARWLVQKDRGQFVRTPAAYEEIARRSFGSVDGKVRHDLLRIPYTLFVMRSSKPSWPPKAGVPE